MAKIVIPKNSASLEEVMGAMQIYYDHNDWLSNFDFIQILCLYLFIFIILTSSLFLFECNF